MPEPYEARHDTQYEPRTWSSPLDCNMGAAADAARFYSLGLIDHRHDYYRGLAKNPDGSHDRTGGTTINQAHQVLDAVGVKAVAYDAADGHGYAFARAQLSAGHLVIAHGDYGTVPRSLRGPIDRSFDGLHSLTAGRLHVIDRERMVRIGDGLRDALTWWPESVLDRYMREFPGGGYTFLAVHERKVRAKAGTCNVRDDPNRNKAPLGTISTTSRIHGGGVVRGESIGGNAAWIRVWFRGKIAYVHTSVGRFA